jgi:hypothetical protein
MSLDQIVLYYEQGIELKQLMYRVDAAEFLKLRYGVKDEQPRRVEPVKKEPVKKTREEKLAEIRMAFGGRNKVEV